MLEIEKERVFYTENVSHREIESKAAHALLEKMLLKHFGINNPVIKKTENQKPYVDNKNVFFSLSHTYGMVVCAVSDKEIGIDIEKITPYDMSKIKRIAGRFFTNGERETLAKDNFDSITFLKIWTRKESYIKLRGKNLIYLSEIDTENLKIDTYTENGYIISVAKEE